MRFHSPIARSNASLLNPGIPTPGTFRLQVFSTSERFTPRVALRLYCTPLALAGFTLRVFPSLAAPPPRRAWLPSRWHVKCPRATAGVVTTGLPDVQVRRPSQSDAHTRETVLIRQ